MAFIIDPYRFPGVVLGSLWIFGDYGTSQNLVSGAVFFNAEQVDDLGAFDGSDAISVVPAGVGEAALSARVMHDGLGGSPAATLWARIQRSTNSGGNWTTVAEGTAFHPGGAPNTPIEVGETAVSVAQGDWLRLIAGSDTALAFGRVIYGNDPNQTFLRATWRAAV